MGEVVLGIDIGTGSTKAGLVDADGRLLAVGRCPHAIDEPRSGHSESDPRSWLDSARVATAEVLASADGDAKVGDDLTVVAVGLSGQMHGVVVCDHAVDPVRPAVLWSDGRSQPYLRELRERFAADELMSLANPIVAGMTGPTVAALLRTEPQVMAEAAWILQPKDWVRHRLTGQIATDASDASATLLWDATADRWSSAACRVFGIDSGWLPSVLGSAAVGGQVSARGAELFGLAEGLPVAVGAADTAAALLGAGVASGETQLSTGTGGQIARLIDVPQVDKTARTHLFRAADTPDQASGRWYTMAAVQNAGVAIDWALGLLDMDLADADRAIADTEPGSNGVTFLPYLTGERTPHLNVGLSGCWTGLRPSTARAELARSVFEGVAFALRDGLEALAAVRADTGPAGRPEWALLAGGGSTAGWWRQMLADVLQLQLQPHDAADASVRGAGLLAWAMLGNQVDPAAAVNRLRPLTPSAGRAELYSAGFERFRAAFGGSALG